MKYIGIFLFSIFLSSVSQIILKVSAVERHDNIIKEYLNLKTVSAYGLLCMSSLITVWVYRYLPLSIGTVLESCSYIFVAGLGGIFLKEYISKRKLVGLCCIIAGILICV